MLNLRELTPNLLEYITACFWAEYNGQIIGNISPAKSGWWIELKEPYDGIMLVLHVMR